MEMAMETTPESFGSVIMLYINCKYDIHFLLFFIDFSVVCHIKVSCCSFSTLRVKLQFLVRTGT
jgi:hypothetical protein